MRHVTGPTDILIITVAPFLLFLPPQSLYKVYPYTLLILFHQSHFFYSAVLSTYMRIAVIVNYIHCLSTNMYVLSLSI